MNHITEETRWKELEDEVSEQEYKRMFVDTGARLTPKQVKINYLSSKFGWEKKELKKLTSKQLGKIKYENNNRLHN